ncbi:MAG TPA: hypothetical protein PK016_01665 [Candidatus Atribacteria bacterium]|nr:hypothetical protein [Candidatus Atribacteria bacterium]
MSEIAESDIEELQAKISKEAITRNYQCGKTIHEELREVVLAVERLRVAKSFRPSEDVKAIDFNSKGIRSVSCFFHFIIWLECTPDLLDISRMVLSHSVLLVLF